MRNVPRQPARYKLRVEFLWLTVIGTNYTVVWLTNRGLSGVGAEVSFVGFELSAEQP